MKPKRKRIVALLLLAAMAAAWIPQVVLAADTPADAAAESGDTAEPVPGPAIAPPEAPESQPEETPLAEETEPVQQEPSALEPEPEEIPEPLDVDLSSGRLLVDSGGATVVGEDEPVLAEHDGIYLLQYDTVEQAEAAYREYSETAKSVEADIPFSLANEEETPVPEEEAMTEDENPLTILEEQLEDSEPVEEPRVIALIDSGAGLSENIADRYSVIDDDPSDILGHGTNMLEAIVSQNAEAQVISIKAFDENGKGTVSSVYAAIQLAIELNVDFINLSACARITEESAIITRTIKDAVARGITFVGAAGNDGADVKDYIPGSIPEATIVGALDSSGSPASFSNYGNTVDYWEIADSTSVAAALITGILSKGEDPSGTSPETPEEPEPSEEPAEVSDENNTAIIRNVLVSASFPDGEGLAYLSEHNEYSVWMLPDSVSYEEGLVPYAASPGYLDLVAFDKDGNEITVSFDSESEGFRIPEDTSGEITIDLLYKQIGEGSEEKIDSDFSLAASITNGATTTVTADCPTNHSPPYPFGTWHDNTERTDAYGNSYTSDMYCLSGAADWGLEIANTIYTYNWNSGFGSVLSNPAEATLNRAGGIKVLVYILATGKYRGSDASWTPHFNDRTYSVLGNRGSWLEIRNSYYGGDCVNGRTYSGDALWITTQVALWNLMSGAVTGTYMMKTGLGSEHPQLPAYFGVGSSGDEFMTLIQGGALALISEAIQWALDGGTFDDEMQYIYDSIYFLSASTSGDYAYFGYSTGSAGYAQDMLAFRPYSPPPTGDLKLVKRVSDSSVSATGWEFTFKNNSTGETVTKTTGTDGTITLTGLTAGVSYTVTEKAYDGYAAVAAQTITIESGKTNTLTFTNAPLKGNLTVTKTVNYGTKAGFKFHLRGTSTIGKAVNLTATTDSTGTAKFTNVYVGTYTLSEEDPGGAYIPARDKTVTITANATTGVGATATATMNNTWKYWSATVTKVDAATGNTSTALAGAEYTLYKNGTAVKTYTVSRDGKFITDEYPCTDSDSVYTLKETKAPEGYQLDSTVYSLKTSYTHYSSAMNSITITVSDQIIMGKIQIQKQAVNTVSGEKKPEKGATYQVWLKSAGSYSNAAAAYRDTITIGEDGKGTSKSLPYGVYCIQQKTGWDGYEPDPTVYEASITTHGTTVVKDTSNKDLKFENNIWTGKLTILKVDKDSRTPLKGAVFQLKGSDGYSQTATTGEDGKVVFKDLVYGVTYTWKETKAPHGYLLDQQTNTGTWSVTKKDDTILITAEDVRRPGSITVTKQDTDGNALKGAVFKLEYKDGETWKPVTSRSGDPITRGDCTSAGLTNGMLTAGADGKVSFDGLWADGEIQYRLTEVKSPDGQELLKTPIYEGTLPAAVDRSQATREPEELEGNTAYFYTIQATVRDGKVFNLPQTGGHGSIARMALTIIAFGMALVAIIIHPPRIRNVRKSKSY